MTDPDRRLSDALKSRGWELNQAVQAAGLMARGRASLGLVTRTRDGALGFAKCIWHAKDSAGPETLALAGADRLGRVAARLRAVAPHEHVPLVTLLDVVSTTTPDALLVVMERVTPIAEMLPAAPDDALAMEILRRFSPAIRAPRWTHFDICPANSAVTRDGVPVLIDPESVYLLDVPEATIDGSCLVAKWHRSPAYWEQEAAAALGTGGTLGELALKKHAVEVCLLAAEVSLGQTAPFAGNNLRMEDWLLPWLAQVELAPNLRAQAAFWRGHLTAALDRERSLDLNAIASELAIMAAGTSPQLSTPAGGGLAAVDPRGRAMRRYQLGADELLGYLDDLLTVGRAATEIDPWFEAGMVCVCFLRDKTRARAVVDEACRRHPGDPIMHQWARMIAIWPGGEAS